MSTAQRELPLAAMRAEVWDYCGAMGWRDDDVLFDEAMALLHSEVGEISDAWRKWGLADVTPRMIDSLGPLPKPEGVGSEFADVLIRLLDDDERYGADLDLRLASFGGAFGINDSFLVNMNTLHTLIAKTSMLWESGEPEFGEVTWESYLTRVLAFLLQLAEHYGIDMMAEYRRKHAYNKARPHRHGDKRK